MNKNDPNIIDAEIIDAADAQQAHHEKSPHNKAALKTPEKNIATMVYALQALALLIPFTIIAGVIINYVKIDDVKGTWLESHFRWQMRTFWFALLWFMLGIITFVIGIGYFILFANAVWVIYRMIKGWLRLHEGKAMYL